MSRTLIIPIKYSPGNFNYYLVKDKYINSVGYVETSTFDNKKRPRGLIGFLWVFFCVYSFLMLKKISMGDVFLDGER